MISTKSPLRAVSLAILLTAALSACSVMPRESPLPKSGPTMEELYRDHHDRTGSTGTKDARARLPLRAASDFNPGPTKLAAQEQIERRFARVANPDLLMTVFPHLAKGKYPIPGYVTMFPMYEGVEYLLPGEAASNFDGLR
jgi:conjugative transfer region lipoprotein (TIGR03751 family)